MRYIDEIISARKEMLKHRKLADKSAENYRKIIKEVTLFLIKNENISQREVARRIGITEGALRALLRPKGISRKKYNKKVD